MIITNARVVSSDFDLQMLDLRVQDGTITAIGPQGSLAPEQGEVILDLSGKILAPGMVDVHVHGAMGKDTMDASVESLDVISRYLAAHGVTSFLATTMTMAFEQIAQVFELSPEVSGADLLGFHMEGPFINATRRGAQNEKFVRTATLEEMNRYVTHLPIKIITLAPETEGALEFIEALHNKVTISLGHTDATYDEAAAAIAAGARSVTHCFNAMPQLVSRQPAVIGAAVEAGIYGEAICDGLHLHPATVYATYKMFGPKRMVLISDALRAAGLGDGTYEFGGQPMHVVDGVARVDSGSIAGSTSNVWQNMRNCVSWNIPLGDAIRMGSLTPAELIGVADRKGSIALGKDADFVVTNDDLEVLEVYLAGRKFA